MLYRLGKLDESLTALEPLPKDDVRVKELKAQIFYKQDKFKVKFRNYARKDMGYVVFSVKMNLKINSFSSFKIDFVKEKFSMFPGILRYSAVDGEESHG